MSQTPKDIVVNLFKPDDGDLSDLFAEATEQAVANFVSLRQKKGKSYNDADLDKVRSKATDTLPEAHGMFEELVSVVEQQGGDDPEKIMFVFDQGRKALNAQFNDMAKDLDSAGRANIAYLMMSTNALADVAIKHLQP